MPETGYKKRTHRWTKEECEALGRKWIDDHDGEIPAATDFQPSDLRAMAREHTHKAAQQLERVRYFEDSGLPWTGTIWKLYGGWNNYIRSLGREPRPPNVKRVDLPDVGTIDELRLLIDSADQAEREERNAILLTIAERAVALTEQE